MNEKFGLAVSGALFQKVMIVRSGVTQVLLHFGYIEYSITYIDFMTFNDCQQHTISQKLQYQACIFFV